MKITQKKIEAKCQRKRIVFAKVGRHYELTTPDGGTTAEERTLADCLDTLENDSTFASLPDQPIRLAVAACNRPNITPLEFIVRHYPATNDLKSQWKKQAQAEHAALLQVAAAAELLNNALLTANDGWNVRAPHIVTASRGLSDTLEQLSKIREGKS